MTIYTKITVSGIEVEHDYGGTVIKSVSDSNIASNFIFEINNYNGRNTGSYSIGDEVKIYCDKDINPPTTQIFLGILEANNLTGIETQERMVISGKDYSARLMDRTIEPEVYNNWSAGSIVKDIIAKYTDDITTNNVTDGDVINRIIFNHLPVYDGIRELSKLVDYTFYIDNDKDLHFGPKSTTSSGYTFGSGGTPILRTSFKERREDVYNEVWVYGDRYLDGYKEEFTGDAGSTYTLNYSPHNTTVSNSGTAIGIELIQPGGIYEMTYTAGSQLKYLVNYSDKKIILTSGTDAGNNLYVGSSLVVNYMRDLPIVKWGDNDDSIESYGRRTKVIQDKSIKDPISAETILLQALDKFSDPQKEGKLKLTGVGNINPGETCIVNIPSYDINSKTYDILEATYNFSKLKVQSDEVLSIIVNKKIPDITDTLKDILLQQRKLQSADIQDSDLLTRYKLSAGSFGMRTSGVEVYESTLTGSQYHLYATGFVPPINPWHLASGTDQGHLAGSYTGSASAFGPFILQWSGGYF